VERRIEYALKWMAKEAPKVLPRIPFKSPQRREALQINGG